MHKKGFTLLEVLIVVIIIGILAAIALPQYTATIEKSRSAEAASNIGALRTAVDRYWYQNNASDPTNTDLDKLDIDNPNNVIGKLYTYSISSNTSTASTRTYTILATRTSSGGTTYTVQWVQTNNNTGNLYRSANLGGPVAP
ncbi:MAG: prepilin-type N-terminal cleavage/methylation domain-containing protein [Candidatus Omnitrophota bacterium]|nr:prepilin-type N-terminal cleavage/methylation domain-containing protein [Candidatus Omnitrophota bacterium]